MNFSRNAPCPCGGGKKYKQCCGKGAASVVKASSSPVPLTQAENAFKQGNLPLAEQLCRQVLAAQSEHPEALFLLGNIANRASRPDAALELFNRALAACPAQVEWALARAYALIDLRRFDEAEKACRALVKKKPDFLPARFALGISLREQGRLDEAIREYQALHAAAPEQVAVLNNLGMTLKEADRCDEALVCFNRLLQSQPHSEVVLFNTGVVLRKMERFDEAATFYQRALCIRPGYGDAHFDLAWCLLAKGDLARGWKEYEWRFRKEENPVSSRDFPFSQWQGENPSNCSILVWGEQGVGDEILFAGTIPDLIASGAQVALECEPRLQGLMQRSFPTALIVARTSPPDSRLADMAPTWQCPAGSLNRWLRSAATLFPDRAGYLLPDPASIRKWQDWAQSQGEGLKIGISWRSMQRSADRNSYYTDLSQWGAILKTPNVTFVNLQYGECEEELLEAERLFGISILCPPGLNLKDDLDDAAALTRGLDLVIAPNTSVFAMAGAVGTPTWLLNLDSDWTMLGTDRMPWFPSVEVFAKSWDEPWEPLLGRVAERLAERVGRDE
jgi:tetratricopeptide (TPR) repeat protein